MVYIIQTNLTMKYRKITLSSIFLYYFALAGGCIVAYFDEVYTKDLTQYGFLCFGVLITGYLGLLAPFIELRDSFPTKKERIATRVVSIVIGCVHFFFLKKICTSSHPDNNYLAMNFYYFFVLWYIVTIFSPRVSEQKKVLV